MPFTPILPTTGILGYQLLTATEAEQRAVFERQPEVRREAEYFIAKIGEIGSAAELVEDRRLLTVALGAFGMDEEIDKRAFLRRVLEEGSERSDAFANLFVDPSYARLALAFGFGDAGGARTADPGFASSIADAFLERSFEIAVGDVDENMRLAISFRRGINTYATAADPDGTAWFSAMGDLPTRRVLEGALGLPTQISSLDIDRQQEEFREAARKTFGSSSLAVFTDPEVVETAVKRFLARASAEAGFSASTPGATALTLLSSAQGFGAGATQGLTLSNII